MTIFLNASYFDLLLLLLLDMYFTKNKHQVVHVCWLIYDF